MLDFAESVCLALARRRGHEASGRVCNAQRQLYGGTVKIAGFELAFPDRRATHEFIVTLSKEAKGHGVTAMDFAKRLLDFGLHAPTTYFPLLIPECLLIEPTETETKEEMDAFIKR